MCDVIRTYLQKQNMSSAYKQQHMGVLDIPGRGERGGRGEGERGRRGCLTQAVKAALGGGQWVVRWTQVILVCDHMNMNFMCTLFGKHCI